MSVAKSFMYFLAADRTLALPPAATQKKPARADAVHDRVRTKLFLLIAAGFEVTFAMGMKYADGFTRLWPSLITVMAAAGGIYFLTLAMRELPVSVAYPVWTAIGSLGTVFLGFALLGESLTAIKLVSVGMIVAGVVGLK